MDAFKAARVFSRRLASTGWSPLQRNCTSSLTPPLPSIGRFHGYRLELLAPVDVKPTRPWRVAIRGSRATDFKSEQKLNADDGRGGLTGHGSRPRDLQRRQLRRLKVLAGNRAPRQFVTPPRLQFPRSAAVPYLPPRNAGRSVSSAISRRTLRSKSTRPQATSRG